MRRDHTSGFTLIEMLVVLGIMMLMSSMIMYAYESGDADAVTADAHQLQTVLQRARSLSLSSGQSHAVIFHIENAGDGSVLKNYSHLDEPETAGGHWYAIVGPDISNTGRRSAKRPPMTYHNSVNGEYNFFTLQDYMEAMRSVQVGAVYHLSPGVRFLALSEVDELYYGESHLSYPRPWFGFYDEASKTLYPWGAYNPEIDAGFSHPNTGLDYEGLSGPVPYNKQLDTNVYPSEVWGRLHFEFDYPSGTGSGVTAMSAVDVGSNDKSVLYHHGKSGVKVGPDTSVLPGKPYPLINGYAADFMIVFSPNGSASVAKGHCRRLYLHTGNGAVGSDNHGIKTMETLTGGYALVLCRDVNAEDQSLYKQLNTTTGQLAYNKFESVEDAYESITPFMRVFVDRLTGVAEVQNNDHPNLGITADDMLGHDPYPRSFK